MTEYISNQISVCFFVGPAVLVCLFRITLKHTYVKENITQGSSKKCSNFVSKSPYSKGSCQ
jgi:hypothetical protein